MQTAGSQKFAKTAVGSLAKTVAIISGVMLSLPAYADHFSLQPRLEQLAHKAEAAMYSDPEAALQLALRLSEPSENGGRASRRALVVSRWLRAEALTRLDKGLEAENLAKSTLRVVEEDSSLKDLTGRMFLTLAASQISIMKPDLALYNYQKAFDFFRSRNDRRNQALAMQCIALIYMQAKDFDRAIRYYDIASEIYTNEDSVKVALLNNKANVLRQIKRYEEARKSYVGALLIAEKLSNADMKNQIIRNLARNSIEAKSILEAKNWIELQNTGNELERSSSEVIYAEIAYGSNQINAAIRYISKAFEGIDLKTTGPSLLDAHELAYEIYSRTGKTALALKHLEAAKRLTEESMSVAASTNSALMAARFDFQNQELRISQLKANELRRTVEFQRARARLQWWIFAITGTGVAVIIAILIFAVVTLRRSRNEVRLANAGLERSNAALEKALAAKTEFLATTSHEIRTPLNGILGMTQVMLADNRLTTEMRDRIGVVHGAGVTMRALVDDILDVAKMETGNLTVEQVPVDLPDILEDVSRMWREQAATKGIAFELDIDPQLGWIESDAARLRQIVFNLLSNAIKFTDSGSVALIARRIDRGEDGSPQLELQVRDSGIGIPADKQHLIFESFRQADASTTRRFGGTGLGLAICRNLADALGGTIEVESVEGQGSTFRALLPLVAIDPPSHAATSAAGMLILERNPIARSTLKTLLEPHAGNILFATSVEEACARIVDHRIRLVLADQGTLAGERDADLALQSLAACTRDNGGKIAVLWPAPTDADRQRAEAAGIDTFLAKPIAARALIGALFGDLRPETPPTPLVPQAA